MLSTIFSLLALFCCGTFFGAALYISLVQHPAALAAGVGGRLFPPMYRRAAPLQIALAKFGCLAGLAAGYTAQNWLWVVGAVLLITVVPVTLIVIKPINQQLLSPDNDPDSADTQTLLHHWGSRHALRSALSGLAFVVYLYAAVSY